jgi:hypothetical protein
MNSYKVPNIPIEKDVDGPHVNSFVTSKKLRAIVTKNACVAVVLVLPVTASIALKLVLCTAVYIFILFS